MTNVRFKTKGMTCNACEMIVQDAVKELAGISKIKADHKSGIVKVDFDDRMADEMMIKSKIKLEGYEVE